ncbi:EAL and GGDEF domain-containing protein [Ornithinibacillus scapharcae]|uniref:sensor domain-containing protein n=1 Tax=Ornithinibacillus scapharcae TaxID=1147159 RepID=UPI000225C1A1|nr:bifunctional diguanylate cyclase/phosphodiesterase [Ornithinibacillus scapharcae]
MTTNNSTESDMLRLLFQENSNNHISQDALSKVISYYASLGNNTADFIMVFSANGELRSINKNQNDNLIHIENIGDFKRILLKRSYVELEKAFENARSGNTEHLEIQVKRKRIFYSMMLIPLHSQSDKVDGIGIVIQDITVHKQELAGLQNENKSYKLIFDHLHIGVWVLEYSTGKLTFASKGLADLYQYPLKVFYREKLNIYDVIEAVVHPDDRGYMRDEARKILTSGESILIRYRIRCLDGTEKWLTCHTAPYYDENGKITHIFGVQTDITDDVRLQEQLKYSANHDLLTTLPNQRSLDEKLDSLFQAKKPFALLFFNLDRFSVINGSLGYQIGDEVLISIGTRLNKLLPKNSFVARLKSNDFIILYEDYETKDSVMKFTEELIQDIRKPLTIGEYEINMTSSVGVSLYPEDGETKESLMDKAHSALSHAKKTGRNTYRLYSYSKDTAFQRKLMIEKDMVEALEKEDFELYYQPLVETQTGRIEGAEALIRWNHKKWGLISPGEFIPIAEENHLISDISDWVIKEACSQMKQWRDKGLKLIPISVNISPIRLMKKGLTDYVRDQLEAYHIPAEYLGVEITEGSLLKSEKGVITTLAELKELGVRVAIDDFGTGFASLNYLREYQADTLKIDQVFIQSKDGQVERDNIIVGSVMEMARGLNMRIIAEGVEEYGQYRFLKNRHCDLIQGYLFSRPVPVLDFERLLVKGVLEPDPEKIEKDRIRRMNVK